MSLIPALFALFAVVSLAVIMRELLFASKAWKRLQKDWAKLNAIAAKPNTTVISIQAAAPRPVKLSVRPTAAAYFDGPIRAAA